MQDLETMSVTHLAGPVFISEGNRVIQRCVVCGEKLIDFDLVDRSAFPAWPIGSVVRTQEGRTEIVVPAGPNVAADFCLVLVER